MKIAVTYENGEVFQHFGHSQKLKIYETEGKMILNSKVLNTNGSGHGAICNLLTDNNVDVLICGGLGSGARTLLEENNIKVYPGVIGNADEKVNDLLNDKLKYDEDAKCNHHHNQEHDCKDHNCNEDKGGCTGNDCQ